MSDPVLAHAMEHKPALIEALKTLVACPSVGADPTMAQGMEKARNLIEARLDAIGFQNRQRLTPADGSGQPAIYAERMDAPRKPTILIYAHYDVQPADPLDKWVSPPFEPVEREQRLYGRGISDDKGPMMIALGTLAAFVAVEGGLPINVKVLIEGEEETGSPSLSGIFETHRDLLTADAVLSADGARWRPDLVTINVGSRGNAGFEVRLQTAAQDLHSGRYGGIVANPLHELSRLIAQLHDENGRIAAPGFYDGVAEPTEAEREEIAAIPYDEAASFEAIGAIPHGEVGYSTLERLWLRPTVDVNGMWGRLYRCGFQNGDPARSLCQAHHAAGAGTGSAGCAKIRDRPSEKPTAPRCGIANIRRARCFGCLRRTAGSSTANGGVQCTGIHHQQVAFEGAHWGFSAPNRDC